MAKDSTVVGLDIGTTKVCCTIGQVEEGLINIIGSAKVPNLGVRKGQVVNIEDTVSAISEVLLQAERMTGVPINSAYVGINGNHISASSSKGVVAISRADGEITASDMARVIDAARTVALPPNREIIHVVPKVYLVD